MFNTATLVGQIKNAVNASVVVALQTQLQANYAAIATAIQQATGSILAGTLNSAGGVAGSIVGLTLVSPIQPLPSDPRANSFLIPYLPRLLLLASSEEC